MEKIAVTVSQSALVNAVNEASENNSFSSNIYPNPADDKLNIVLSKSVNNVIVKVISMNGAVITSSVFKNPGNGIQLNVSTLNGGVYMLQLQTGTLNKTYKFLKK